MGRKTIQDRLKHHLKKSWADRRKTTAGFTILEVLMAITVGSIVTYAMLSLVVNLLGTDQRETAKSQTQAEMSQALDYIAEEMQQAVYIYEGSKLDDLNITFEDVTPVLAFWKLERVPYKTDPTDTEDKLPEDCSSFTESTECYNLLTTRHTYTLIVYGLATENPDDTWEGPARITRYQLRQYANLSTLEETDGYDDPGNVDKMPDWKSGGITVGLDNNDNPVLVDLVDNPTLTPAAEDCATGYSPSPSNTNTGSATLNSFYACVRTPEIATGNLQDAIVYLRGNAAERAGQPGSRNQVYLPSLQRRIHARTIFNKDQPEL